MASARKLLALVLLVAGGTAGAAPPMMSTEWADALCAAWNEDPVLRDKLAESGWIKNHKGRGYKAIQLYRDDCPESPRVELQLVEKEGRALCRYGGKVQTELDDSVDYLMWAITQRWQEMGRGDYGPMRAMLFGRLHFQGPMGEAMGNMGPFANFLLLVGKVPGEASSCPPR